ncbi:MAG: YopX family protein [Sporolactobacillus sp.]
MRQIKFRGKRTGNSEWEYGDLAQAKDGFIYICESQSVDERYGIGNRGEENILHDAYSVQPKTVGQYTGLKDKNGREIYEGDIVHFKCSGLSGKGYVYWAGKTAQFKILDIRDRTKGRSYPFYEDAVYRVDGNIYENPGLLKEGAEE